jgi:mannose-6-phosphate isomerase
LNLTANLAAYPLRTEPFFRDYLWGGRKLQTRLGKSLPPQGVWAESWELIDHPEHQSLVANGPLAGKTLHEVTQSDPKWLLGKRAADTWGNSLPLLLKYLDCQRVLSVQVHPDDVYASRMTPPDLGKTEAWYIIDAEPTGVLYAGLKPGVTPQELSEAIEAGQLEDCLHKISPKAGDCVFIPAGTVHALGAGLLVAEIQQASNTTFRLYDWNRVDADGRPRALHVPQALEVIDFDRGPCELQTPQLTDQAGRTRLVDCDKFVFDRISNVGSCELAGDERFHFLTAPYGGIELKGQGTGDSDFDAVHLDVGDSVVLPGAMPKVQAVLEANAVLLDMYVA